MQNKGYYAIQGNSRSSRSVPIESLYATSDFLLVINSNWHPISYRFGVIAAYCSNFGHYVFAPPLGGLGITYDVHLGLIGERVVLKLVLIVVC